MDPHDTDHAALPCPLYAGGHCGPTPTTTALTAASGPSNGSSLPFTGAADIAGLTLLGAILVAGGLAARSRWRAAR